MKCKHKRYVWQRQSSLSVARHCADCGEQLSLGPSNDSVPPEEILAAELGQHPEVWRRWQNYDTKVGRELHRLVPIGTAAFYWAELLAPDVAGTGDDSESWSWDPSRPVAGQYEARTDAFEPADHASTQPWADPSAETRMTDDELVATVAYSPPGSVRDGDG